MANISGTGARELWDALVDNATALVSDAQLLHQSGSNGRARSLLVLAQEEVGKALWLYDTFATAWNTGDDEVRTAVRLSTHGRSHVAKYIEAATFGNELAWFWGDELNEQDDPPMDAAAQLKSAARRQRHVEEQARQANERKQHGFYVDYDEPTGEIRSPMHIGDDDTAEEIRRVAQVVEMLLINGHSRMKFDATSPYDSTHKQQRRLLPISHPDEWASASDLPTSTPQDGGSAQAPTRKPPAGT